METIEPIKHQGLTDIGNCQRLKPKEEDVVSALGKKGHRRRYREDGSYEWNVSFKPNEGGKPTREFQAMCDLMKPFARADVARFSAMQAKLERATLKDADGKMQFVDAALADSTAQRNGWGHHWRAGGCRIERGVGGMLWRWISHAEGWSPTGRTCLGTPLSGSDLADKREIQYDPEGTAWEWKHSRWRVI